MLIFMMISVFLGPPRPRKASLVPDVICDTLNVQGATYANCDGRYKVVADRVAWAPDRPVYKHVSKDRYIFWNAGGLGWSIGKQEYLASGSHWHRSKFLENNPLESSSRVSVCLHRSLRLPNKIPDPSLWPQILEPTPPKKLYQFLLGGVNTPEPWQGRWNGGVVVECVGRSEPQGAVRQQQPQQPGSRVKPEEGLSSSCLRGPFCQSSSRWRRADSSFQANLAIRTGDRGHILTIFWPQRWTFHIRLRWWCATISTFLIETHFTTWHKNIDTNDAWPLMILILPRTTTCVSHMKAVQIQQLPKLSTRAISWTRKFDISEQKECQCFIIIFLRFRTKTAWPLTFTKFDIFISLSVKFPLFSIRNTWHPIEHNSYFSPYVSVCEKPERTFMTSL